MCAHYLCVHAIVSALGIFFYSVFPGRACVCVRTRSTGLVICTVYVYGI